MSAGRPYKAKSLLNCDVQSQQSQNKGDEGRQRSLSVDRSMRSMSRAVVVLVFLAPSTPLPHTPRRLQMTTRPRPSPPPVSPTTTDIRTPTQTTTCTWPLDSQPVRSRAEPPRRYSYFWFESTRQHAAMYTATARSPSVSFLNVALARAAKMSAC